MGEDFLAQAAHPALRKQHGCIINITDVYAERPLLSHAVYCAAKAGILGFTRSLAREVVSRGLRVNAVAPGFIDTDLTAPFRDARALLEAKTPMGRFGAPKDIE